MQDTVLVEQGTGTETINAYISVDEMARMLSIARVTAYQLTKTSGFPCFYIGKRIIIPLQAFHRWADEQASRQSALFEK
jgi:excisionase family DNA binding protein